MNSSFHFLLMITQSAVQKKIMQRLKSTGLTPGQPKVLEYLTEHDGARPVDIARSCHIEAPTLTSILTRMERDGLIERKLPASDRRSVQIYATDKSRPLQQRIAAEFSSLEAEALNGFSDEGKAAFMNSLQKIHDNLQKKDGKDTKSS